MTTTKPSQKDHLQHAVDVLEGENAELRQIASVLVLQILAWGPTVEPPDSGASHSSSELISGRPSRAEASTALRHRGDDVQQVERRMPTGSRRAISREAVVLNLMQPSGARRRLGDLNGEAGLDEADRQGYADALT